MVVVFCLLFVVAATDLCASGSPREGAARRVPAKGEAKAGGGWTGSSGGREGSCSSFVVRSLAQQRVISVLESACQRWLYPSVCEMLGVAGRWSPARRCLGPRCARNERLMPRPDAQSGRERPTHTARTQQAEQSTATNSTTIRRTNKRRVSTLTTTGDHTQQQPQPPSIQRPRARRRQKIHSEAQRSAAQQRSPPAMSLIPPTRQAGGLTEAAKISELMVALREKGAACERLMGQVSQASRRTHSRSRRALRVTTLLLQQQQHQPQPAARVAKPRCSDHMRTYAQ